MDQDSAHMVAASKVPMLKPGEYEIWRMRIEQYIQMIDYALWEVIENGATLPKTTTVEGVVTVMPITTAEEKAQRRLEVKARSTLMMGIPNEHQLKFNSIKDAKKLLEAVEKRFMLDQTFDRLQNLMSQLELLDEKLSQEDVNQKLLRSLSPEWNTHAVVWRNKADLDTMSMDDLYNNLKVYEPEVKGMSSSMLEVFENKEGKLTVNDNETISFDKSKVECYNCHKRGHFARECRALRNQDNKNKESSRRSVPVETSTSIALVSCDGLGGYEWSDQAEEGPNYALMAFSSDLEFSNPYLGKFHASNTWTVFYCLDEFVNEPVVENSKAMSSKEEPKVVRKNDDAPIIEEWVSDDEEEDVSQPKIEKKTVRPSIVKKEFVKSKQQKKLLGKLLNKLSNIGKTLTV
ncbi:putative ribonuclease H-like domain-containing protein [Tanacetum coccineum]